MTDEQAITTDISDNSENITAQEPDNSDNSFDDVQEPEVNIEETQEEKTVDSNPQENQQQPQSKFKSLEEAIAAHSELEKKLGENSRELGELRKQKNEYDKFREEQLKIVQNYGFNSLEEFGEYQLDLQHERELAAFEADEYLKYVNECQEPAEMRDVLLKYRQNPSKELLEFIEAEFPVNIIKNVAGKLELAKGQLQNQKLEAQKNKSINSAREYLITNVDKYSENFKNPAFVDLYAEAFKKFGPDLDTDKFVNLLKKYTDSVVKSINLQKSINKEEQDATNEIAGLSIGQAQNYQDKPLNDLSDKELESYIKKFV